MDFHSSERLAFGKKSIPAQTPKAPCSVWNKTTGIVQTYAALTKVFAILIAPVLTLESDVVS
jgi:hypothetical protein